MPDAPIIRDWERDPDEGGEVRVERTWTTPASDPPGGYDIQSLIAFTGASGPAVLCIEPNDGSRFVLGDHRDPLAVPTGHVRCDLWRVRELDPRLGRIHHPPGPPCPRSNSSEPAAARVSDERMKGSFLETRSWRAPHERRAHFAICDPRGERILGRCVPRG